MPAAAAAEMGSESRVASVVVGVGEEYGKEAKKKKKTSVWWDMNKCGLPEDGSCDPYTIAHNIAATLLTVDSDGGPVTIFAYGDMARIPSSLHIALSATGILLTSSSSSGSSITRIVADMLLWAIDNPAPANFLLISGDCDFSYALHQLHTRGYNIFLAQPQNASMYLTAAVPGVWLWNSILTGRPTLINGRGNASKGKNWRSWSELDMLETSHLRNDIQDQSNKSAQHTSLQMSIAPHEFFNAKKHCTDPSLCELDNGATNGHPHLFSLGNPPIQHNCAPHSFFQREPPIQCQQPVLPMQNGSIALSGTRTNIISTSSGELTQPPFSKTLNLENLNGSQEFLTVNSTSSSSHSSQMEPYHLRGSELLGELSLTASGPKSSAYLQGLMGVILLALDTLRSEKIIPTEENITNCIRFGDSKYCTTDVRLALNHALEKQMVVRCTVGAMHIYVIKNSTIWNCVNPLGGNPKQFSKATWNEIERYLSSSAGQFKMMVSDCRYEAATYLKKSCLKNLALGDVIQILDMVIHTMRWIEVDPSSGWQPIRINLAEVTTGAH